MSFYLGITVAIVAAVFVFDLVASTILRWLQPILPSDAVGDEGWLVDTKNHYGIYDR